nr:39S ribosomal protein L52, mitochondrial isoform X2 [Taeniopygia guttata]
MAARRVLRLAERQARSLRPLPRPPQRIGQWREAQGLSPSPSGPGPLRDLPDWSFSDGRPSPPWRGQERRISESRELMFAPVPSQYKPVTPSINQCRAVALSRSLEAAKRRRSSQYKPVWTGEKAPPPPEALPTSGHAHSPYKKNA